MTDWDPEENDIGDINTDNRSRERINGNNVPNDTRVLFPPYMEN